MMMNAGRCQKTWNRSILAVDSAVRQHEECVTRRHRGTGATTQLFHGPFEPGRPGCRRKQHRQRLRLKCGVGDVSQRGQLFVVENGIIDLDQVARSAFGSEKVALRPQQGGHVSDELLPDRIERWVGDLGEQLLEIFVKQSRAVRQHRQRRIGPHRSDRLGAGIDHRPDQDTKVFLRVPECTLTASHRLVGRGRRVGRWRQIFQVHQFCRDPVAIGPLGRQTGLDLFVVDDASLSRVDQEDATRV